MEEFTLTIRLGNDAMQTGGDIADALHKVAERIDTHRGGEIDSGVGRIMDDNGNHVGDWSIS